jgi:hypothetical protein
VPFSELIAAINATKECLWEYLEREDFLDEPVELIGDLNLLHAITRFFDRVIHSAALGYESFGHRVENPAMQSAPASARRHNGKAA